MVKYGNGPGMVPIVPGETYSIEAGQHFVNSIDRAATVVNVFGAGSEEECRIEFYWDDQSDRITRVNNTITVAHFMDIFPGDCYQPTGAFPEVFSLDDPDTDVVDFNAFQHPSPFPTIAETFGIEPGQRYNNDTDIGGPAAEIISVQHDDDALGAASVTFHWEDSDLEHTMSVLQFQRMFPGVSDVPQMALDGTHAATDDDPAMYNFGVTEEALESIEDYLSETEGWFPAAPDPQEREYYINQIARLDSQVGRHSSVAGELVRQLDNVRSVLDNAAEVSAEFRLKQIESIVYGE